MNGLQELRFDEISMLNFDFIKDFLSMLVLLAKLNMGMGWDVYIPVIIHVSVVFPSLLKLLKYSQLIK